MEVGRNDPCPCGSGEKYKKCCQGKQQGWSGGTILLFLVLGLIALTGLYAFWASLTSPPEEAPAGRVWSEEHGHYHDGP